MNRSARLEHFALLAIASSLTALWLGLWIEWAHGAWASGVSLPAYWAAGLALAGVASASLTDLALRQRRMSQHSARLGLACAGAVAVLLLVWSALGLRVSGEVLRSGPRLVTLAAPAGPAFLAAL
jgi:hypothetical protein